MSRALLVLALFALASCDRTAEPPPPAETLATPPPPSEPALPPVTPPAPGQPGGLPDDRTPISEAPFTPTSAQGAANVVQTYYASIGAKDYAAAWKLLSNAGMTEQAFAASFDAYDSYNANIGAPGAIEGAAGSLFVEVPVQIYGRRKTGQEVHMLGSATLRRVNDVPGSTPEQRSWRIQEIKLTPTVTAPGSK